MRVAFVSDVDFTGSGYSHITINLCKGLAEKGHDIKVVGLSYHNEQHPYPFSILPVSNFNEVVATIHNLHFVWKPEVIIVALDIPQQEYLLNAFRQYQIPYIAITPLESGPLCQSWAMALMQAQRVYFISQYGADEANKKGVNAEHIQIGVDTVSWKLRTEEEYKTLRKKLFGIEDDTFIVLTVADNQERKNLSAGFDIIANLKHEKGIWNVKHVLVTRAGNQIGWRLTDLAIEMDILDNYVEFERGLPFKELWSLYACADAYLSCSRGEGAGLPITEAMSVGVPIVGTKVGAIIEHIERGGGWLIEPEYSFIDPYGNAQRHQINKEKAAQALLEILLHKDKAAKQVKKAREYVESRTWDIPVNQLDEAIRSFHVEEEQTQPAEAVGEASLSSIASL